MTRLALPRALFAVSILIGIVGAFYGLKVSSFWIDELFTAWVIGHHAGFTETVGRALTDVHPPAYYLTLYGFTRLVGDGDLQMRLFSVLCAVGAVAVLLLWTRGVLSLGGRMFGAAVTVATPFWFVQAQNARDYALCLLLGSILFALCARAVRIRDDPRRLDWTLAGLGGVMLYGAFVHYYLMFESLAALMVLALYLPRRRGVLAAGFLVILAASFVYLRLVVHRRSLWSLTDTWIANDPAWLWMQALGALRETLNHRLGAAVAICAVLALWALIKTPKPPIRVGPPSRRPVRDVLGRIDWVLVLAFGVPVITNLGGVASSALMSPNVIDRNLLVCSPFLWAGFARLYDLGPGRLGAGLRPWVDGLLGLCLLAASALVLGRAVPHNEPFRESAQWIRTQSACRGQVIPVLLADKPTSMAPGYMERTLTAAYGHYLDGFANPAPFYVANIQAGGLPADLKADLVRRLSGQACPILAWTAHGIDELSLAPAEDAVLKAIGQPEAKGRIKVQSFAVHNADLHHALLPPTGFILYVEDRPARP